MLMKRPQHRVFDYPPRFYKPEEDPEERRKKKLGFQRNRKFTQKRKNPIIWLVFIIILIFIIMKLGGKF